MDQSMVIMDHHGSSWKMGVFETETTKVLGRAIDKVSRQDVNIFTP
jgi:hypothetical protein